MKSIHIRIENIAAICHIWQKGLKSVLICKKDDDVDCTLISYVIDVQNLVH